MKLVFDTTPYLIGYVCCHHSLIEDLEKEREKGFYLISSNLNDSQTLKNYFLYFQIVFVILE